VYVRFANLGLQHKILNFPANDWVAEKTAAASRSTCRILRPFCRRLMPRQ
jgi:hypothetical protein